MFDADVCQCFLNCMAVTITDASWCQAQLPLHFWGLGLCPLSHHANAAFIVSYSSSGWLNNEDAHLNHAIDMFNEQVALCEKISLSFITSVPCSQKGLSLGFRVTEILLEN